MTDKTMPASGELRTLALSRIDVLSGDSTGQLHTLTG